MTILREEYVEKIAGNNRKYVKLILHLKCDECEMSFICNENTKSASKTKEHHFCSKACSIKSMSGGLIKEKRENTNLIKYGHKAFTATKEFKTKFEDNCLVKYGVKSHLKVPEILEKIKKTNIKKYGRETFAGSEQHKSALDYQDIVEKAWVTKIKNQQTKNISSKQEERVYKILCKKFLPINIIRGKKVLRQFVDFYISALDKYIQVDGVYWHGLNRPLEDIKKFATRQDEKIYKQILRDKKLNEYCIKNNLKLIRITDQEINNMSDEEILSIIMES